MKEMNTTTDDRMSLCVVIPVYNASATIRELLVELTRVLRSGLDWKYYQVVLVNDCSTDNTDEVCRQLLKEVPYLTYVSLRKNVGEHNAVMCGLSHAHGHCVVIMDDDLQNPPSEIIKLYDELHKGYDVVYSRYRKKKHSLFRNLGSWVNDRMATVLLEKPRGLYLSSFKIIRGEIVTEILRYKVPFPYIDGLILRVTSNIGSVEVEHAERKQGRSNYDLGRLVSLYLNMFVNFSIKPLRLMIFMGFFLFLVGVVLLIAFVIEKLIDPTLPIGWTAIATLIITFSGFQILFLGVMGEYIGKQYLDQNGTPQCTEKLTDYSDMPDDDE